MNIYLFMDSMLALHADNALSELDRQVRMGRMSPKEAQKHKDDIIDKFDDALMHITLRDFPQSQGMPLPKEEPGLLMEH